MRLRRRKTWRAAQTVALKAHKRIPIKKRLKNDVDGAMDGFLEVEGVVNSFSVRGGSEIASVGDIIDSSFQWFSLDRSNKGIQDIRSSILVKSKAKGPYICWTLDSHQS